MGGTAQRFLDAGYAQPKPLIDVDGRPMLAHLLADLAGCEKLICGVHAGHLQTTKIAQKILEIRPDAQIVPVQPHKDGPVRTLLDCAHVFDRDLPLLLHYADFATGWNFDAFRHKCEREQWDAALDAYSGNFPHLAGPTLYAGIRADGDRVLEIREKHCFAGKMQDGWHSAGSYWVKRAGDLLDAAQAMVKENQRVAGEFFVSTALGRLVEQGAKTGLFPLEFFHQWGTPEDLRTWQMWHRGLEKLDQQIAQVQKQQTRSTQLMLMAGRGQRFVQNGEQTPKPFVPVAGEAMVAQALKLLAKPQNRLIVLRAEDKARLETLDLQAQTLELHEVTQGQAITADLGLAHLPEHAPVLVTPCDAGHVFDQQKWAELEARDDVDLVIFTAKWHQPALWKPQSYGWALVQPDGQVNEISVKKPVADVPLQQQQVITGQFWTTDAAKLRAAIADLQQADERVNGEFYLDSVARRLVAQGQRVWAMPVELWMSWGTPQEVADFHYWNQLFRGGRPPGAR